MMRIKNEIDPRSVFNTDEVIRKFRSNRESSIQFGALFRSLMGCSLPSLMVCDKRKKKNDSTISEQHRLTENQIEQLLKTRFNRSEILDWHRAFLNQCKNDENHSAHIDKRLFIDYFNQLHPNGDVTHLSKTFFRTYDINHDGNIDFMEFMHVVSIIRRGDLSEKLSLIFSLLDSNQEGLIDRFKLVQMMEALYQVKGLNVNDGYNVLLKKVDHLITRLDKDKDGGRIPRYKFIESCLNDTHLKDLLNTYK